MFFFDRGQNGGLGAALGAEVGQLGRFLTADDLTRSASGQDARDRWS